MKTIFDRIKETQLAFRRAREMEHAGSMTFLIGQIERARVKDVSDAAVIAVIKSVVKALKDVPNYDEVEVKLFESFLPRALTAEEISAVILVKQAEGKAVKKEIFPALKQAAEEMGAIVDMQQVNAILSVAGITK